MRQQNDLGMLPRGGCFTSPSGRSSETRLCPQEAEDELHVSIAFLSLDICESFQLQRQK